MIRKPDGFSGDRALPLVSKAMKAVGVAAVFGASAPDWSALLFSLLSSF